MEAEVVLGQIPVLVDTILRSPLLRPESLAFQ